MKKFLLIVCAAVCACAMTSCSTAYKTASTRYVNASLTAHTISDLEVSNQKITYTYVPTNAIRRGGVNNCVNSAISEALAVNGNGDVLIETQHAVIVRSSFFTGRKVQSVTVTGYPAKYKNFRVANDSAVKVSVANQK